MGLMVTAREGGGEGRAGFWGGGERAQSAYRFQHQVLVIAQRRAHKLQGYARVAAAGPDCRQHDVAVGPERRGGVLEGVACLAVWRSGVGRGENQEDREQHSHDRRCIEMAWITGRLADLPLRVCDGGKGGVALVADCGSQASRPD